MVIKYDELKDLFEELKYSYIELNESVVAVHEKLYKIQDIIWRSEGAFGEELAEAMIGIVDPCEQRTIELLENVRHLEHFLQIIERELDVLIPPQL